MKAGVGGRKTNHSLRATTATRLLLSWAGVPEQLTMERTGHRRVTGISLGILYAEIQCYIAVSHLVQQLQATLQVSLLYKHNCFYSVVKYFGKLLTSTPLKSHSSYSKH